MEGSSELSLSIVVETETDNIHAKGDYLHYRAG